MKDNVTFRIEAGFSFAEFKALAELCHDMQDYYGRRKGDYEVIVRRDPSDMDTFWAQGWRVSTQQGEWRVIYSGKKAKEAV